MSYGTNPHLPRIRREAVQLVRKGWKVREVTRYMGYAPGTISKWVQRAPEHGKAFAPTKSSRPASYPHALDQKTIDAIAAKNPEYPTIKPIAEVLPGFLSALNYAQTPLVPWYGRGW